ncbi:ABC transporter ATP-binding protein [Pseudomonas oryzihabitans]|uniref:ABC transporter ATP-binding protein n=1 Tax=Pseudomonas oryzihabitans TaxID=47885 RepID=UPI00123BE06B|nr:ABC transporter ATP-binding protein [Pseudomonas oryzihabitans]QEU02958.1 ABC transporter ATP-binding protein [Pseudomonas oryzihabitans]
MSAARRRERRRAEWPLPERVGAFLWRYVRLRPWHFGGLLLLVVGAATCAVAVQYGMKLLVDAMADPARRAAVWGPFWLFISLIVLENLFWRSGGWLGCRTVVASCADLRVDLFRYLTGHPMHYFSQHFAGALGNRISATGAAAGAIYGGLAWKIMPPCVDFIGAVVVLCTVDLRMAGALVAFVVIVALVITAFGIRGRARHQRFAAQSAHVGGELVDLVQNVWTIKAFSAREREVQRLAQAIGVEARAQRSSWMHLERARVLHDTCLSLMAGGMLAWAIALWSRGSITAGDVVMVSALTFRILHGSRDLALALVDTTQQLGAIGETLRILIQPHGQSDVERPLTQARGALSFTGVHYRYPDGRQVFQGFDLEVPAGQKIGLVGPSGAGKSTLIGLLQRLDDIQRGRICIDGEDIRTVSQDSLRQRIAVVPQETALFNRSIRENIRYGRPEASDAEVEAAARHAYCDDFIRELPQGYDTPVGERGVLLSGGQRQRLGIARAFLKDAPILILDEATSALDSHSETVIQRALLELMEGRTVVAVAHRLSTLSGFDRILVLEQGVIVEDGPPQRLREGEGSFAALWDLQAAP